jgi:hypothetical protein
MRSAPGTSVGVEGAQMGTDLKRFVRRALMETRGIELDPEEITEVSADRNPVTGKIDVHATIVMRAPPQRIVITTKEVIPEEKPE